MSTQISAYNYNEKTAQIEKRNKLFTSMVMSADVMLCLHTQTLPPGW